MNDSTNSSISNSTGLYYQPSARAIAFGFTGITTILTATIFVLALWRAKYQPLKARNAYFMILHTLLYAFHIIANTLYIGIGKETWPCFLHLTTYSFAPMCVAVNATKSWRLLFKLLASHLKADIHKAVTEEEQQRLKTRLRIVSALSSRIFFVLTAVAIVVTHVTIYVLDLTALSGPLCAAGEGFRLYFLLLQMVIPIAIHILIFFVCGAILLIGKYEDTWSIRAELLIMPVYWIPIAIICTFSNNTHCSVCIFWWFPIGEEYFPASIFPWTGATLDLIICMLIPSLRTFVVKRSDTKVRSDEDREKYMSVSMLRASLQNETLRSAFLKFTTKSMCCENLCFWIDVKIKFEIMEAEKQKLALSKFIAEHYLRSGSVSELNLDSKLKNTLSKQVIAKIEDCEKTSTPLPKDMFKDFAIHVELDLMDSFSRFIMTPEYWRATEQKKGKLDHLILCCK